MLVSPKPGRIMVLLSGGRMVIRPCQAYMCLVHGKVENRIHSVETSFAELGGPEGGVGGDRIPLSTAAFCVLS